MTVVEVIVPAAGTCPYRARALEWVRGRYEWPVTVAPGPTPWSKGAAVMPAIERSCADVIVVADADVWTDGLPDAIAEVQAGVMWAVPHRGVHRLTEASTAAVIDGARWEDQPLDERPYLGIPGGGIVVARRDTLLDVPLDPRFVGWGQEDESWGVALRTLLGPPWRGRAPLVHLWHPSQPRLTRTRGSHESWQLRKRYLAARDDPAAMRLIVTEAQHALSALEPAVHDHSQAAR